MEVTSSALKPPGTVLSIFNRFIGFYWTWKGGNILTWIFRSLFCVLSDQALHSGLKWVSLRHQVRTHVNWAEEAAWRPGHSSLHICATCGLMPGLCGMSTGIWLNTISNKWHRLSVRPELYFPFFNGGQAFQKHLIHKKLERISRT